MCGTVGLFAGCAAVSYCPRRLLGAGAPAADGTAPAPLPRMPDWDARATVRTAPRRELAADSPVSRFFPAALVPVASHPAVLELPADRFDGLLTDHAYRYLDFTERLEVLVVNRVALGIARGTIGVPAPPAVRRDAYRVYVDEAYHALVSADLALQLEQVSGRVPRLPPRPGFLVDLERLLGAEDPALRPLVEILFVICSETLISGTLSVGAAPPDTDPTITEAVRDHARDEGRHHTFFATYLRHLWGALDARERAVTGRLVPDLVAAFLRPEVGCVREDLMAAGLARAVADEVVEVTFDPARVAGFNRSAAARTFGYFEELGAFEGPEAAERRAVVEVGLHG